MANHSNNDQRPDASGMRRVSRSPFFLPLVLVAAFLNIGGGSGGGQLRCQGKVVTHTFDTSAIATNGDDVILVIVGNVNIFASGGNDTVCVITDAPGVTVYGGPGDDEIHAGGGGNVLRGEGGDDWLVGGTGVDLLYGGIDDDILEGGDNIDYLLGDEGNDQLYGGDDDDYLDGGAGQDALRGEGGDDLLDAGHADEVLDWLDGGAGDDRLYGDLGPDVLIGGDGNDELLSGDENGILVGGSGTDTGYPCSISSTSISEVESVRYTDHCPMESEDVFSARLEIRMCGSSVSGWANEGALMISLNGEEVRFLGDYPASPWFPIGSTHVYDFLVAGELRDISEISIRSQATNDAFCLSRVRLGDNHFTDSSTTPWKWLFDTGYVETRVEEGATLTYSFSDLRSDTDWRRSNFMPFVDGTLVGNTGIDRTGLDYETLERLLEGLIDDAIRERDDIAWQDPGIGGELVSANEGMGDSFGNTTDACNNEATEEDCTYDESDIDQVCARYPDMDLCTTDCNLHPYAWICSFDWEDDVFHPINPCIWRAGMCQFPNHADVRVILQKKRFEARDAIDVTLLLKVACQDNQLKIEPDKFHVNAQGLAGGNVAERRVRNAIAGIAAGFTLMVPLPNGHTCATLDPDFDHCGLWLGVLQLPRPDANPLIPFNQCQ